MGDLFESRQMKKRYLAVVDGVPPQRDWKCEASIAPDPKEHGRMILSPGGKEASTRFVVLDTRADRTLLEAQPLTGRTHQIRLHLVAAGFPIIGDDLYGKPSKMPLALRAVELAYADPFTRRPVRIRARSDEFLKEFGFQGPAVEPSLHSSDSGVPRQGPAPLNKPPRDG